MIARRQFERKISRLECICCVRFERQVDVERVVSFWSRRKNISYRFGRGRIVVASAKAYSCYCVRKQLRKNMGNSEFSRCQVAGENAIPNSEGALQAI